MIVSSVRAVNLSAGLISSLGALRYCAIQYNHITRRQQRTHTFLEVLVYRFVVMRISDNRLDNVVVTVVLRAEGHHNALCQYAWVNASGTYDQPISVCTSSY